jgi:hypothetical protein
MTDAEAGSQPDWSTRLHNLAKPLLFQSRSRDVFQSTLPDVNEAIRLACDLLVQDMDTPATINVAALPFGTPFRDCQPLIRAMLLDQGVPTPDQDASDDQRFGFMLKWFAAGHLTLKEIWSAMYWRLPDWKDQTAFQRALVRLDNELENQDSPAGRVYIVNAMRAVAACPADATNAELPLRIKVESAFRVTGRGTVLAGAIEHGTIRAGDEIELELADEGDIETVPLTCKSVESVFQSGRDPARDPLMGLPVSGIEPESVNTTAWVQRRGRNS